tara:strand:- start:1171 stop:1701 length:531 start_codon:yes stop_codon:yes gene_type:complete
VSFFALSLIAFLLQGCLVNNSSRWPENVPEREYFESIYRADAGNQLVQSKADYLQWVVSFYEGTLVAPQGWLELQSIVLEMSDSSEPIQLSNRLTILGGLIAGEWAKENEERVIDSGMLSLWASIMQLSIGFGAQESAILLIEKDVNSLLAGELAPNAIDDERYEQQLDIDLFDGF